MERVPLPSNGMALKPSNAVNIQIKNEHELTELPITNHNHDIHIVS